MHSRRCGKPGTRLLLPERGREGGRAGKGGRERGEEREGEGGREVAGGPGQWWISIKVCRVCTRLHWISVKVPCLPTVKQPDAGTGWEGGGGLRGEKGTHRHGTMREGRVGPRRTGPAGPGPRTVCSGPAGASWCECACECVHACACACVCTRVRVPRRRHSPLLRLRNSFRAWPRAGSP